MDHGGHLAAVACITAGCATAVWTHAPPSTVTARGMMNSSPMISGMLNIIYTNVLCGVWRWHAVCGMLYAVV